MSTIFETCASTLTAGSDTYTTDLIQCVSEQEETLRLSLANGVDSFWLIYAGALVFFMQTGFAMLCAGSVRAKNVKHVILWNLLDSAGGGFAFWATGFAFTYGGDTTEKNWTFLGNKNFFLQPVEDIRMENFLFQWAFACALSSIVAGTIAERTQMKAYLIYSFFLVAFVYPVVAHAFWSQNGFLSNLAIDPLFGSGAVDLAGSGPVHMAGGVCALACVLVVGNRVGRFHDKDGNVLEEPVDFPPHDVVLQFLGTFCLWFGWYGFNPGSTLVISNETSGNVAALVAVNTTLGASLGAISGMLTSTLLDYFETGYHSYDLTATMNGCLTGLAAITAAAASVDTYGAVIIGIVAGWVYLAVSKLLIRLKIDDAVDAIPVHMGGGCWGLIATGLLSKPQLLQDAYGQSEYVGWFYEWGRGSGDFTLMGCQLVAVLFVFGWIFVVMTIFYRGLNYLGWLRIDYLEEEVGLDISRHKGGCYDLTSGSANEEAVLELRNSRHKMTEDRSFRKSAAPSNKVESDDSPSEDPAQQEA